MRIIFERSRRIAMSAVAIVIAAFICVACGGDDRTTNTTVVMYKSVDSTVQSSTAAIVNNVASSVVEIRTESVTTQWGMQYVVSGAGSGVIVAHTSDFGGYYIITNNHVIEGARQIEVTLRTGEQYEATLVATDVPGDVAVITISETRTLNVAILGDSDRLQVGEDLLAIGNPLGSLGGTVTKGILSATERSIPVGNYTMTLLQTDTAINPGNSGGGLFNMNGDLIGIVNAKTTDEEIEGICFAIPINTAMDICEQLIENGYVTGRATFGISVALGNNNTVYVTDATGADADTFMNYDKIAEINGVSITSLLTYNDVLMSIKPGDEVTVKVYRGSIQQSLFGTGIAFASEPTTFKVAALQLGAA